MPDTTQTYRVDKFPSVHTVPDTWDELAGNYFQKRNFLAHNEKYNPCRQRYYMASLGGKPMAGAVVYTLPVDLLTFARIPSPLKMQIIGLPVSVSEPGMFGEEKAISFLLRHILQNEKGLILGLNLSPGSDTDDGVEMRMLPTLELDLHFDSINEYVDQLSSAYRRRYHKLMQKWEGVTPVHSSCKYFSEQHYKLYRDVLHHSHTRLETLKKEYFENLPDNFSLTSYYREGELLCWHICCEDPYRNKLCFFFGGHDYRINNLTDAYFNNLAGIVEEGIAGKFAAIEFGQTAEEPKMRMGAELVPKFLFLYHRSPLLRYFMKRSRRLLEYPNKFTRHHVFRSTPQ